MEKRGFFIVFEGVDGGGKSTQIKLLKNFFEEKGYTVLLTKEPTDNSIGSLISQYAESNIRSLQPNTEALLFAADRVEHSKQIEKHLKKGIVVISDRYLHSSLAYQSAAGVDVDWIRNLNKGIINPDIVFLLDIDPDISLMRVNNRDRTVFEKKAYLIKVREKYLEFAKSGELIIVDASRSIEKVQKDIRCKVKSFKNIYVEHQKKN
jgi:dTMP kinase